MSSPPAPTGRTVLIVDDSAMDRHLAGALVQKLEGWNVLFAGNGIEALEAMARQTPDLVLTDMLMPEMDGLELVQSIRATYPLVPVILMTAHGSEDHAILALQKGAASYVPKNRLARDLLDTIEQVMSAAQSTRSQLRIHDSMQSLETLFVMENDTSLIPPLVNYLEEGISKVKLCEPSGLILLGVALHESLTNAIFHGNLELSSSLKESDEKQYYQLAKQRLTEAPYCERRVHVNARLNREEAVFTVRDDGPGFDPTTLPDPTDPSNLGNVSGRGLLLIQTFMDHVEHNEKGNEITMIKRR